MVRFTKALPTPLILLVAVSPLWAQGGAPRFLQTSKARIGGSFQSWSSEGADKITEWVLPVLVQYAATRQLHFTLFNQPTLASRELGAARFDLRGLTDTKLGASYIFGEEKFIFNLGLNLPSGRHELEANELPVAQLISIHALGLRTNYFGGGFDVNAGLAAAYPTGDWVFGGGVGLLLKGKFKPLKGSGDYNPGEELNVTVGFDRRLGENAKLMADAIYTLYATDSFQGTDFFKSGQRLVLEARSYFRMRSWDITLVARDRIKAKNQILQPDPASGVLKLREEAQNSHGNELDLLALGSHPISPKTRLNGLLQTKLYGNNQAGTAGALVFSVGAGAEIALSRILSLDLGAKLSTGSMKGQKENVRIRGIELQGGIIYQF